MIDVINFGVRERAQSRHDWDLGVRIWTGVGRCVPGHSFDFPFPPIPGRTRYGTCVRCHACQCCCVSRTCSEQIHPSPACASHSASIDPSPRRDTRGSPSADHDPEFLLSQCSILLLSHNNQLMVSSMCYILSDVSIFNIFITIRALDCASNGIGILWNVVLLLS
jgi:hypothetical protein